MTAEGPSISATIGEIRRQLELARADGESSALRFEIGPVEMTFAIGVEGTSGIDGGVRIWVLQAGAKHEKTDSFTQTVTVTLTPYEVTDDGRHIPLDVAKHLHGRPDGGT